MTKQELKQQFVSCVEYMPDALLIDPDDPKFTWKISYNSAEHVVENFPQWCSDRNTDPPELACDYLFGNMYLVDDMPGEQWFLSWRDKSAVEIPELEELL